MNKRVYKLTAKLYKVLKKKGIPLVCYHCGEPLRIGDTVLSYRTMYNSKRYHLECYEKTFVEEKTDG